MSTPYLAAIEARAAAAFPAPWTAWDRGIGYEIHTHHDEPLNYHHRETFGEADAEFIAHARTDVPALLALVREQAAKLEAVRAIEVRLDRSIHSEDREIAEDLRAALEPTP